MTMLNIVLLIMTGMAIGFQLSMGYFGWAIVGMVQFALVALALWMKTIR